MKNCKQNNNTNEVKDKLTDEEIKELREYAADMYHRAMVKIAWDKFDKVDDIRRIANEAIQKFALKELEIIDANKKSNLNKKEGM